jgi:hypothetical protein
MDDAMIIATIFNENLLPMNKKDLAIETPPPSPLKEVVVVGFTKKFSWQDLRCAAAPKLAPIRRDFMIQGP